MMMRTILNSTVTFSSAFVLALSVSAGTCDPPINEDCDSAIAFSNENLPFTQSALLGCVNDEIDKPYWDVFYRFDCDITGEYTFSLCDSDGDTYIRIYENGCGWNDGDELAVADDECPGSPPNADPVLPVLLNAGETYWIEVGTWRDQQPWGAPNLPYTLVVIGPDGSCVSDIEVNGAVDVFDLLLLLNNWTTSGAGADIEPPTNVVDVFDLLTLLADWGSCV